MYSRCKINESTKLNYSENTATKIMRPRGPLKLRSRPDDTQQMRRINFILVSFICYLQHCVTAQPKTSLDDIVQQQIPRLTPLDNSTPERGVRQ
ncbi:hypothetical protein AVEN_135911-1 [Araneus ventricosus]|uniref:Uncharacterized protein n=1 Tax=Araneus ventricosus TaxID=182803 RepID=A0A4Y2GG56_ARAVE|nr:hypothetical protein AVEN_135911-1 [Araneus ventricosus]